MSPAQMNLLQGTLDVLVLRALAAGPRHGYAVAEWIQRSSDGTLGIEDGALYTSLHRMEKRGLLESTWGASENNRRAKYYALTAAGERELGAAARDWARYAEAVFKVLGADPAESGGPA
jgi:PadR family transcriptional regulator